MPSAFASATALPFHRPSPRPRTAPRPKMAATPPMRRVLVPIGTGSEEIETASVVDTLRRAGAEVTIASVEPVTTVKMSRGMKFQADVTIENVKPPFDAVALPGGMPGAERLAASVALAKIIENISADGKIVAGICAAPAVVLAGLGMLDEKKATCYPAPVFREKVPVVGEGDVVTDTNVVTATGPGTALKWSLQLVEKLYNKQLADKLAGEMLAPR